VSFTRYDSTRHYEDEIIDYNAYCITPVSVTRMFIESPVLTHVSGPLLKETAYRHSQPLRIPALIIKHVDGD